MALIVRNDEQIKVGVTPGLIAGESFFIFDGTSGKKDYRETEIVISELNGRGILIKFLDYTWDPVTGRFDLIQLGDIFPVNQYYNVHFQPLPQPLVFDHYSLINSSFFIRNINLTNLDEPPVLERLNYFIAKYEPECLKGILGTALYNIILTEASVRVNELVYGAAYIGPSGFERFWEGLVHDTNISIIANYIYFYYQQANALQTVGTSTKAAKSEAGISSSPRDKMIAAWMYFGTESRHLVSFLWNAKDDDGVRIYPEFTSSQYTRSLEFSRPAGVNYFDI